MDHLPISELQGVIGDLLCSSDILGYVACGLVLLTFCMQAMVPLRLVALLSNAAFISYSWNSKLLPIFILHIMLAFINVASLGGTLIALSARIRWKRSPFSHSSRHVSETAER